MKLRLFRLGCAIHAVSMAVICVLGVVAPHFAMSRMTGMDHAWDPSTLSLMRMQTGGDFGIAIGFALIAWRPISSLSAFLLCACASVGHGLVHLGMAIDGGLVRELLMIGVLIGAPLILAVLYPFKEAFAFYREPRDAGSFVLRATCCSFGLMMIGIGLFGLFDTSGAMTYLAGQAEAWSTPTLGLMRMHTAADVGLGLGLFAAAYRPSASFAALMLGAIAASAHGTVHVLEEVDGSHLSENVVPLVLLSLIVILMLAVTPWKTLYARYSSQR